MTFEEFKGAVDLMTSHHIKVSKAYDLNIDLIDFNNDQCVLVNALWSQILTVEGLDWFNWFLYEKDGISGKVKRDMKAYSGKKEILKDLKGLYNYLTTQKYFKVND
jgi:hypothetical protein